MATDSDLASAVSNSLSVSDNDLSDLIKIQGDIVRKLKSRESSERTGLSLTYLNFGNKIVLFGQIDEAVTKLLDLKNQLAAHQGANGEETGTGGEKLLKTPRVNLSI